MKKNEYRFDIQSLRGLAVLLVIMFHLNLGIITGGYIGVDIFFVISGFLITKFCLEDLKLKKFKLANFYNRRIKKLIPPFFIVLILTYISSFIILEYDHFKEFSTSMFYSLFSLSNIYFWLDSGYFSSSSMFKPLLHTWSLSVEGQFYLIWPIVLMLLYKNHKLLITAFLLIIIISFSLNKFYIENNTAFFNAPTRSFQFILGALILFFDSRKINLMINNLLFIVGYTMIIYSSFFFDKNTIYPYLNSLIPTFGSFLVILTAPNIKMRLLFLFKNSLLNFFGRISYPLYLVHWPLIVLIYYLNPNLSYLHKLGLFLSSIIISYLMDRFISKSFSLNFLKEIFSFSILKSFMVFSFLILFSVMSFNGEIKNVKDDLNEESRLSILSAKENYDHKYATQKTFNNINYYVLDESKKVRNLVIGDSHAAHLIPSFKVMEKNQDSHFFFSGGCIPLVGNGHYSINIKACKRFTKTVFDYYMQNKDSIQNIIFSGRWAVYYTTVLFNELEVFNDINGNQVKNVKRLYYIVDEEHSALNTYESRNNFLNALKSTVNFFNGEDKNVILFGQIPPFGFPSSYIGTNKIKNNAKDKRERIEGFNSWAESYCNEEIILKNKKNDSRGDISKLNCTYIDLAKYFEKNGKLTNYLSNFFAFYDYTHLNTKASIILGMLIKQELNASLK